jgi:hypothetical protein
MGTSDMMSRNAPILELLSLQKRVTGTAQIAARIC